MRAKLHFLVLTLVFLIIIGLQLAFYNGDINLPSLRSSAYQVRSFAVKTENSSHCSAKTYVIILDTRGQQGSGLRALSVLQCVLGSIYGHFYIVEPFIQESHVSGIYAGRSGMKFSSLYDFNTFNLESRKLGFPEMVSVREYVERGPPYIIFVYINFHSNVQNVMWSTIKVAKRQACLKHGDSEKVMQGNYSKVLFDHCIVRVIQLPAIVVKHKDNRTNVTVHSVDDIYNFIFDEWKPHEVTLVFSGWGNKIYLPVHLPLHGMDCIQRYSEYEIKLQFKSSTNLIRDAEKYENMFLGGQNKLAVMLRVERTVSYYLKEVNGQTHSSSKRVPSSLEECYSDVLSASKAVLNTTNGSKPVVTMDINKFGTESFLSIDNTTKELTERTLVGLYDNQWSVEEWEDSFTQVTGGVTDISYVVDLQKTLASRADCLVLMGGGSFQALTLQEYLNHRSSSGEPRCVHLVCVMMTNNTEVQKTLKYFT